MLLKIGKKLRQGLLLVSCLFLMPVSASSALAGPGDAGMGEGAKIEITGITAPDKVDEGKDGYSLGFSFEISIAQTGQGFQAGQEVSVSSNIGELFSADWEGEELSHIPFEEKGEVMAYVSVGEDQITFTFAEAAESTVWALEGSVVLPSIFTAKDVGAAEGNPVEEDLQIGTETKPISFQQPLPPSSGNNMDLVDVDSFWKNGWPIAQSTGAVITMEANPIGSLDLYGSTTCSDTVSGEKRAPEVHRNLLVRDEIPEKGFIDLGSIEIYAAVPTLAQSEEDYYDEWHKYSIPAGTYYAKRSGTMRYDIKEKMTELTQEEDETEEAFTERIKAQPLSWGIYRTGQKDEIFLCNFGTVGDPDDNNGILYKDLEGRGAEYAKNYPQIFGDDGVTGGNVVSYYIEFDTYYPDIVGSKKVSNSASWSADGEKGWGNSAEYVINNGGGTGVARRNELILRLVDEDDPTLPIAGADFKVQIKSENGTWKDTLLSGQTDENGRISFSPFTEGSYRLVQTSSAEGYIYNNKTYGDGENDKVNKVTSIGEFEITGGEYVGFGTVVTNWREYRAVYEFVSGTAGAELPASVKELLPQDPNAYRMGSSVPLSMPGKESVSGPKSPSDPTPGIWSFQGYQGYQGWGEGPVIVSKDTLTEREGERVVLFTGVWTWTADPAGTSGGGAGGSGPLGRGIGGCRGRNHSPPSPSRQTCKERAENGKHGKIEIVPGHKVFPDKRCSRASSYMAASRRRICCPAQGSVFSKRIPDFFRQGFSAIFAYRKGFRRYLLIEKIFGRICA